MTHRDTILPPSAEHVIAALEACAELIEAGHCKGQAHTVIEDTDCWCLMAALTKSCATAVVYIEHHEDGQYRVDRGIIPGKSIREAALTALRIAMSPRWSGSLAEFNDVSSTDAVINLCHRAIGLVRKSVAA